MLSLPEDLLVELMKSVMYIGHLIEVNLTSRTFCWTDCDQNIYYTKWYENHPITYDYITQAGDLEAGTLKLIVSNVDKTFSDLVQVENIQNKPVTIKRVFLDANLDVIGTPTLIFYGFTDEITIDENKATISVADELIKWQTRCPRRIHEGKCTWREFKGFECQYTGVETWCDRSWERCVALTTSLPVTSATAYDGGVPTDETSDANDAGADDMTLVPADGGQVGDYYRWGYTTTFSALKLNVTTAATSTVDWTIILQYWNGAWTLLPDISDETNKFTVKGTNYITWSIPTDWAAIAGVYYVRAYMSVAPSAPPAVIPKGGQAWISNGQFLNFGGFRFLPDMVDKEIWWGRAQKSWMNVASAQQARG